LGEVDVETFPTLLVAHGDAVCFFGPVQPSPTQVARLLDSLLADPHATRQTPAEARALLHRLQRSVLPKR
jgi:thioredoxin 1